MKYTKKYYEKLTTKTLMKHYYYFKGKICMWKSANKDLNCVSLYVNLWNKQCEMIVDIIKKRDTLIFL